MLLSLNRSLVILTDPKERGYAMPARHMERSVAVSPEAERGK